MAWSFGSVIPVMLTGTIVWFGWPQARLTGLRQGAERWIVGILHMDISGVCGTLWKPNPKILKLVLMDEFDSIIVG